MALTSISPFIPPLSVPSPHSFRLSSTSSSSLVFLARNPTSCSISHNLVANSSKSESLRTESSAASCLNDELLRRVSGAKDADQAMDMIVDVQVGMESGEVSNEDCRSIIAAAIDRGNVELALSVFHAMRSGFGRGEVSSIGFSMLKSYKTHCLNELMGI